MLDLLFALLVGVGLPARAWHRSRQHAPPTPAVRYVSETLLLTGVLAMLLWRRGVPLRAIGLQIDPAGIVLRDVAICLCVVVGLDVLSLHLATRRLRQAAADPTRRAALLATGGTYGDALTARRALAPFVAVSVVGAAWEELCFRAVVFLLVPRTVPGLLAGTVFGSLLFGAQHLRNGRRAFVQSSRFGVMFALLYLATGDLVAVVIAHAAGNILAVTHGAPRLERARQTTLREQRPSMFLG